MIIIFLGPQASGKGTQAKKLAEKFSLYYLSTGQMFRDMKAKRPDIAKILGKGELVPDDTVISVLTEFLKHKKVEDDMIIDGTPRSVYQYEELNKQFQERGKKINFAVFLNISEEETVRRLSGRRMDPDTGNIYNLVTFPKPGPGVDIDKLVQRDDDKPEAIKKRLQEYHEVTEPLVNKLRDQGILIEINGEQTIENIHNDIVESIKELSDG